MRADEKLTAFLELESAIRLAQSKCRGEKTPVTQVSACVLQLDTPAIAG